MKRFIIIFAFFNFINLIYVGRSQQADPTKAPHPQTRHVKNAKFPIPIPIPRPSTHSNMVATGSPKAPAAPIDASTVPPMKPFPDAKGVFRAEFPALVDQLLADLVSKHDLPPAAVAYIRRNLEYNVPHGKLNRGLAVFQCFKAVHLGTPATKDEPITTEMARRANLLGWCVELLQAFFLVADDIMDDSVTRRGQPCFYRLPEIGLKAINDSLLLESMIFRVLKLHFRNHVSYVDLVELFQEITTTTEVGQLLDLTSQDDGLVQLDQFSEEVLARIYKYKTSHYTFYLPVALGMRLAGVTDEGCYQTAKKICLEMGYYFQAQDDFLDAFGDPEVTGKVGTDIEENTCTWLVVQALQVASEEDRRVLQEHYGKKNKKDSDAVKELYVRLGLKEKFAKFEQESYESMKRNIAAVDNMPTGAFEFLLAKIYKREK